MLIGTSAAAQQLKGSSLLVTSTPGTITGEPAHIDSLRDRGFGTGTIRHLTVDANGDLFLDSNVTRTVGTFTISGAWTFSALLTATSGFTLSGNLTPGSGTLPVIGNVAATGGLSARGDIAITASGVDEVRIGRRSSFNWPMIIFEDAGFPQWSMHNDSGKFLLYRRDGTTGNPPDDPAIPFQIDGNIIIGPYGRRLLPATPYGVDIGSQQYKFGALWTGDLYADRLVTIENIGTVDNRWLIGSGNVLDEDLSPSATSMVVRYNNFATGTFIYLQKFARTEFIKTTSSATLTNKVSNGSFETGAVTNWSGSGATLSASTAKGFHGEYSMLVDASTSPSAAAYGSFTYSTGTTYTVCVNARRVDGATLADGDVAVLIRNGTYLDMVAQQTVTDGWGRFCRTAAAGSDSYAFVNFNTKGVDMYLDAVQVEETSTQRPYSEYRASYSIARNQESGTTANQWYAGDGMMSVGAVTGDGWLDCYAIRGTKSATEIGPACVANVRIGSNYNDWTPFAAWGNLNGLYGISSTRWGFRAGYQPLTTLGADTVEGFTIKNNGTMKMQFDTSGNGFLDGSLTVRNNVTVGTSGVVSSGKSACAVGTGFWLAYNSGTPQACFGVESGNRIEFSGTDIDVQIGGGIKISGTGISVTPNTSGTTYSGIYGYNFTSAFAAGDQVSMWAYESNSAGGNRQISIDNVTTASNRSTRIDIRAKNSVAEEANIGVLTPTGSGTSQVYLTGDKVAVTIPSPGSGGSLDINGSTGFTGTKTMGSCSVTMLHGWITGVSGC